MIRVISGSAKGKRLKLVPGDSTRPIMDRAKEALFSIIGRDIIDATVLDLFAGTGSVGIEALSRGASKAVFIDLDRMAIKTIQENLELTKLKENAIVRRADALSLLKQTPPPDPYDFIYIAPPQYKDLWWQALSILDSSPEWIGEYTKVIVQIDPNEQQDKQLQHLEGYDSRIYGKTLLWFFEKKDEEED
ncbi:MAG: 16S rRNA (guanine(966)-N(2))-methyltransferase RsmD [Aggregatilineales bacterium]